MIKTGSICQHKIDKGGDLAKGGGEDQTTGARSDTPVVFISYASADKAAADSICAELERGGFAETEESCQLRAKLRERYVFLLR